MVSNAYYQDELRYLREVGPEFAQANPEIARFLGDRGSDPDVERILEGVAFLCGRIRQKLDDELPELTASMMSLLWPHYLRPIPSMTILEFTPDVEQLQAPLVVEAGAEFAAAPVDGTQCRYRSCWPTTLRPWKIKDARLEAEGAKPVRLVITLQTSTKAKLEDLGLDRVRFHPTGDPRTSFTLYLLLAAHVDHVTVSDGGRREELLGPECVAAAGLGRDEAVIPYPPHSFAGYRLIQEYFTFKERFLFFDVLGLDRVIEKLELTDTLQLAITFNRRLESFPLVSPDNVRLHCVPIINLFKSEAEPIRLRHDRVRYLVHPSRSGVADRRHVEIFSVDGVSGIAPSTGAEPREYHPFYSFTHTPAPGARAAPYYQMHLEPSVLSDDRQQGTDMFFSFVSPGSEGQWPEDETISIELTCTNRALPGELRAGDITVPTDSSPAGTQFRNILKPTPTISPPLGKRLHWRLISHMSLNHVPLTGAEHLKALLRVYDFQSEHDAQWALAHQRMLDGIVSVRSQFAERMVRGAPLRGVSVEIELDEDHFAGEGDAFLFASILDRFMSLYVTINAYSQLTVRFARSGQRWAFPPRSGDQPTPVEAVSRGP